MAHNTKKISRKLLLAAAITVLMAMLLSACGAKAADPADLVLKNFDPEGTGATAFGTEIPKADVASITLSDTLEGAPENAVDVSENGSGKVLLWTEDGEEGTKHLFIAGDGGLYAPAVSDYLFGGKQYYLSLREINLNGVLNTENVTSMKGMFYGCSVLEALDLTGFNTAKVTRLDWMFSGCGALTTLDLSHFSTELVEDFGWMFQNCRKLETLNLTGIQIPQGANTFLMFQNCRSLERVEGSTQVLEQFEADT